MKKSIIVLLLALLHVLSARSQTLTQYGIKAGLSVSEYDWEGTVPSIQMEQRVDWLRNIALYAEWFNHPYISAVTQLEFTERGSTFRVFDNRGCESPWQTHILYYASLPIFARIHPFQTPYRPYLLLGPRVDCNLYSERLGKDHDNITRFIWGTSFALGIESDRLFKTDVSLELRYNYDFQKAWSNLDGSAKNKAIDIWFGIAL